VLEQDVKQNFFGERIFHKRYILAPVRVILRKSINNIFASAVRLRDGELLEHVSSGLIGFKGNKKKTHLCGWKNGTSVSRKTTNFVTLI
jgi:hypothetical protein